MRRFKERMIFFALPGLIAGLFFFQICRADSAAISETSMQSGTDTPGKRFSLTGLLTTYSGLQNTNDPDYRAEMDLSLRTGYFFSKDWAFATRFDFKKELTLEQRYLAMDGLAGFRRNPYWISEYVKWSPAVYARIPISDQSRNQDSMLGGGQASALIEADGTGAGIPFLSLAYRITGGKNFYTYTESSTGDSNIEYDLEQMLGVNLKMSRDVTLSTMGTYYNGFNYNAHMIGKFEIDEELDYQVSKGLGLAVGLSNSGDSLQANGQNSNIAVYSPQSASVYGQMVISY